MDLEGVSTIYSDDSPFIRLFKNPGRVRMLNVFVSKPYVELSAQEVSQLAGINDSTFYRNIDELELIGIVEKTGENSYTLDEENEIAMKLVEWNADLLKHSREIVEQTEPTTAEILRSAEETVPRSQSEVTSAHPLAVRESRMAAKSASEGVSEYKVTDTLS